MSGETAVEPEEMEGIASPTERHPGPAMSGWNRVLGAGCGVAIVIGGLLALAGSRWGVLLVAGSAVVIAVGPLAAWRRSGRAKG